MSGVTAVFVGEEHAARVAFGEEAGLFERDGGADASAFADHADAAFGRAIVVRATVEQHAAAAIRASLFRQHGEIFLGFSEQNARGAFSRSPVTVARPGIAQSGRAYMF